MGSLDSWNSEFKKMGCFIPPYTTMGEMDNILGQNIKNEADLTQLELESIHAFA